MEAHSSALVIGQYGNASSHDVGGLVAVSLVCVGALIGTVVLARIWAKRIRQDKAPESFTLDDLRQMQSRGEINAVEFEALKQAMIAGLRAKRPADGKTKPK